MRNIRIIAKTSKGRMAMEEHIRESMQLKRHEKFMWKTMGYTQDVFSGEPFTITITIRNKHFQQIIKAEDRTI